MSLDESFSKGFRKQQIGTILLIVAIVLLLLNSIIPAYIVLAIVLGIDLYLVKKKDKTITQWFRPLFPKRIDTIVTLVLIGVFIYSNPIYGLYFLVGSINGHLNGDW